MGIAYAEDVSTLVSKVNGVIKEKILASSDWAHLAVAAGSTIATSTVAAGATTCTVASGAPYAIGRTITFWRSSSVNGAATPECRVLSNVSGTTLTWVDALTAPNGTYQVGDAVGVGTYCKATTTRGAQMVVDLEDATITAQRMQLAVYRQHDGTTAVDKAAARYIYWKGSVGATTDKVYVRVSAGKEHLYIDVEGPKPGETNADNATYGSYRQSLAMCDIVPYFSGTYDAVPAVCLIANTSTAAIVNSTAQTGPTCRNVYISRDAANANSWVTGHLRTLVALTGDGAVQMIRTYQPVGLDGSLVMFPFVVFEDLKGIRGSLNRIYCAEGSATSPNATSDPVFWVPGMEETYGGITYRSIIPWRSGVQSPASSSVSYGWGGYWNNISGALPGPIIFLPKA